MIFLFIFPKKYAHGKYNEAPEAEYEAAENYCLRNPVDAPRLLPSTTVDTINELGCGAWGLEYPSTPRFAGKIHQPRKADSGLIRVETSPKCQDVCVLSNLPIMAGLYDIKGKIGIYYEVQINRMDGFLAIGKDTNRKGIFSYSPIYLGTACRPYPVWRLPGWNRLSAGLHLDDFRKFFEDPDGGRDYTDALTRLRPGDIIGCGFEFQNGVLFYTHNGIRLPPAFSGIYLPRQKHDVFAAIGVEGRSDFLVNFGADIFTWKEGNEWAWRVDGHVGRIAGGPSGADDELPAYQETA